MNTEEGTRMSVGFAFFPYAGVTSHNVPAGCSYDVCFITQTWKDSTKSTGGIESNKPNGIES